MVVGASGDDRAGRYAAVASADGTRRNGGEGVRLRLLASLEVARGVAATDGREGDGEIIMIG